MAVNFYAEDIEMPSIKKNETKEWIKSITTSYGKKVGDVSYIFCNDQKILEVNKQYLDHDYYTDIITFDYTEGDKIAGDIFISVDTVQSNAEQFGESFVRERHRVIIPGILHLCRIAAQSPEDRATMIENEHQALAVFTDYK